MKNKVICIVGATASGKTSLSIELAKKIDAEIISADSMQIYKKLDIATAKVTKEEMEGIPHHMIDICDVEKKFSVAEFKNMCYDEIDNILKKGKNVIVVGGTGLYMNAIVYDMQFEDETSNQDFRNALYKDVLDKGKEYIYEKLKSIDENAAKDIHPNNVKRVIRAIEIAENSDKTKTAHLNDEKERLKKFIHPKYEFFVYYIDYPRDLLYERINKRVDIMVEQGLVDEAKMVYDMKLDDTCTCMQSIGYKEFFEYFEGKISLEESIDNLKKATRHYAKRQMTWFNNKLECMKLTDYDNTKKMIDTIITTSNI